MVHEVSVPGNLLLLGEYTILEPGGLGLTVAPEIRTRITLRAWDRFEIHGNFAGGILHWSPEKPSTHPLFAEIFSRCNALALAKPLSLHTVLVSVDSSAFYASSGNKLGLGSSGAAAAGLSAALLSLIGLPRHEIRRESARIALEAHRAVHNGRGSGYDICTSVNGSMGLFTGGDHPSWVSTPLNWLPDIHLFSGQAPVATHEAVERYQDWKTRYPQKAAGFKTESNRSVLRFIRAASWEEAKRYFLSCRNLGLELGEEIGVSASITPPIELPDGCFKASGAGNELGFVLADDGIQLGLSGSDGSFTSEPPQNTEAHLRTIRIAREGIVWK